jgi:hypothetical protein
MLVHVNHLLVRRLVRLYNPWTAIGLAPDFTWLESATPVSVFKPELVMDDERDMEYHKGRVKFFIDHLQKGLDLEPIEVDNACDGSLPTGLPSGRPSQQRTEAGATS